MSKKKIKAKEYMTYDKTETFDLGESKGKFDKIYMSPLQALDELVGNLKGKDDTLSLYDEERIEIVKTALKRYNQLQIDYDELNVIHNKLVGYKNRERDDVVKKLKALKLLDDCDIDVWLLKHCDYENYCRIRKLCLEATGNADVDDAGKEVINLPTPEEYDFLKGVLL